VAAPEPVVGGGRGGVTGALGLGTLLCYSRGGGDGVGQDLEHFVGKQKPRAPSLCAAPAPEQSPLRSAVLCDSVCSASTAVGVLFSLLLPPYCHVRTRTLSEYDIKRSFCKPIPLKRTSGNIHQVFFSVNFPPVYSYPLSMCQTLNNKGKKAKLFSLLCHGTNVKPSKATCMTATSVTGHERSHGPSSVILR